MAILEWDEVGKKFYKAGVDRGVLYKKSKEGKYPLGVAWNGLTAVNENPSGAEATSLYANNSKYLDIISNEEFSYTIEAYTYPDAFAECDGSKELSPGIYATQQTRNPFGMTYRTKIGNDIDGIDNGYEIHIVYDSLAKPSSKDNSTINENVEAVTMSWECSTTPVKVKGFKPTAHLIINSTKCTAEALKKIEDALYGTESEEAHLPLPDELLTLIGPIE